MEFLVLPLATMISQGKYATLGEFERKLIEIARSNSGVMTLEIMGNSGVPSQKADPALGRL